MDAIFACKREQMPICIEYTGMVPSAPLSPMYAPRIRQNALLARPLARPSRAGCPFGRPALLRLPFGAARLPFWPAVWRCAVPAAAPPPAGVPPASLDTSPCALPGSRTVGGARAPPHPSVTTNIWLFCCWERAKRLSAFRCINAMRFVLLDQKYNRHAYMFFNNLYQKQKSGVSPANGTFIPSLQADRQCS